MKKLLLVVVLLLVSLLAFAENPFLGEWRCGDDRYSFSDSHLTGIMDGAPYESDYHYSQDVMIWRDRAWTYLFIDADHFYALGFVTVAGEKKPMLWGFARAAPSIGIPKGGA